MSDRPRTLYDLDRDALAEVLADEPSYRVDQLWQGLYRQSRPLDEITTISKDLRSGLEANYPTALDKVTESISPDERTIKWLWEIPNGGTIETVLMHYQDRSTVCISTQAGCAMGCGFCATGQAGFNRHLSTGEIVEQVVRAIRRARPRRVSNIVFMGMGEPLANYTNTWAAAERLHGAVGISARHLTISTVGLVPGIRRLAEEELPVNLAVSLHAANDELRDELVPINKRYPLADLMEACADYLAIKRRRLSFEWAMIADVNDRESDAHELAELARALRAHVNLIPLNPTPGYEVRGTPRSAVNAFCDQLHSLGVNATVRHNRGTEIDAACGQLAQANAGSTPVSLR